MAELEFETELAFQGVSFFLKIDSGRVPVLYEQR